ncbi:MAG: phage Gp37/Gp68 family protein [Planctomycetes bacterium]|nr:phage Gp37/Gp68 family protein [Planctomycetota bacterium]
MSNDPPFRWTDAKWNPVRGCKAVSPGCDHCWAAAFAHRWRGVEGHAYEQGFALRLVPDKLLEPLSWTRSRTIEVAWMSDLFQERVKPEYVARVFTIMGLADWHHYRLLTKRAARMRELVTGKLARIAERTHIGLGVSVEDRKHGLPRIDELRRTPAGLRFVVFEPLLEDLGRLDLRGIDWVLVGGESGPHARPIEEDWVLSIRDQCAAAKVRFCFKGWGGLRRAENGRELGRRTYETLPVAPKVTVPPAAERRRRLQEVTHKR